MIDAQLTTEIFFYSPGRPDFAVEMAEFQFEQLQEIMQNGYPNFMFLCILALLLPNLSIKENLLIIAEKSRNQLPNDSYASKMYDFVKSQYDDGLAWETIRDNVYVRYQVEQKDGYDITSRNLK